MLIRIRKSVVAFLAPIAIYVFLDLRRLVHGDYTVTPWGWVILALGVAGAGHSWWYYGPSEKAAETRLRAAERKALRTGR